MSETHLTGDHIEQYIENPADASPAIAHHLAACAPCRARVEHERRLDAALRALPRTPPPQDLVARIGATVELRAAQTQARQARMPLVAVATFFSTLLVVWFGMEVLFALEDNGALYLASIFASQPDLVSTYSFDAIFALIELLPVGEMVLTLCALLTASVLAQQLLETMRPPAVQFK